MSDIRARDWRSVGRGAQRRSRWPALLAAIALSACASPAASTGSSPSTVTNALGSAPLASVAAGGSAGQVGAAGTLVATLPTDSPRDVETAFGSVWVSNGPAATVTRLDPSTRAAVATITVPDPASVLAAGDHAMWLTSYPGNSLTRIDAGSNTATRTVSLASAGSGPIGVTVADGFVWVANHDGSPVTSVAKVDPSTMAIVDVIPVGSGTDSGPNWLSFGAGSIWTDVPSLDAVVRIDPRTDKILATIHLAGACGALAATDADVWVAGGVDDGCAPVIERIDAKTGKVRATIDLAAGANPLAVGPDGVWFGTAGAVGRVDPAVDKVAGQSSMPGTPFGEAVGFGFVWLSDADGNSVYVVRPD